MIFIDWRLLSQFQRLFSNIFKVIHIVYYTKALSLDDNSIMLICYDSNDDMILALADNCMTINLSEEYLLYNILC